MVKQLYINNNPQHIPDTQNEQLASEAAKKSQELLGTNSCSPDGQKHDSK